MSRPKSNVLTAGISQLAKAHKRPVSKFIVRCTQIACCIHNATSIDAASILFIGMVMFQVVFVIAGEVL